MFKQGGRLRTPAEMAGFPWMNRRRCRVGVWLSVTLLAAMLATAEKKPTEYDVKAAYLVNFGRFMRHDGEAAQRTADFGICVLGEDPMGPSLDAIADNEKIGQRPVRVKRMTDAREARTCDIVYISAAQAERISADLEALRGSDALTVSDAPDFLRQGGMIKFVLQGDHVRFSVNLEPARKAHVVLSSDLLRVALSVEGAPVAEVTP